MPRLWTATLKKLSSRFQDSFFNVQAHCRANSLSYTTTIPFFLSHSPLLCFKVRLFDFAGRLQTATQDLLTIAVATEISYKEGEPLLWSKSH